jgi:hypothetical protein
MEDIVTAKMDYGLDADSKVRVRLSSTGCG